MTDDPGEFDSPAEAAPAMPPGAGLCAGCVHARLLVSGRGSRFVLCQRSRTDSRFPRYPSLPVRACAGFEPEPAAAAGLDADPQPRLSSADITKNGL